MKSVLGKRARTAESSADTSISSRVKRRAQSSVVNDENVDPNSTSSGQGGDAQNGVDWDDFDRSVSKASVQLPAKSALGQRRIALSPRHANGQGEVHDNSLGDKEAVQLPTPKTPRHRNALSKRVPITPRHRIGLIGKSLTPSTPRNVSVVSNVPTVYNCARQLFSRGADPGRLVGREDERQALQAFIEEGIASKAGRSLYVSGPPGTGKSALISEVCETFRQFEGVRTVHINCMSVKCSMDISGKLIEELIGNDLKVEDEMALMHAVFVPRRKTPDLSYVITLDEIDHLLTLDLEILYSLFEWSFHQSSRLIIIGIANALDLTDRFLPRLKAKNLKPQLLPFLPYTAQQIASVVTAKLKSISSTGKVVSADHIPLVHPTAIQLCSKKVASQSGDLRKAFDIIRQALDLIETETKQRILDDPALQRTPISPSKAGRHENWQCQFPSPITPSHGGSLGNLTPTTAPRATIAHLSRVSAVALSNGTSERLQTLNLQQRAVLCTLISHQKGSRKASSANLLTPSKKPAAPTVRMIFQIYCVLCKRDNALHPLTSTEFVDIIHSLETLGLVGEEKGGRSLNTFSRTPSRQSKGSAEGKRIVCFVDEGEMKRCCCGADHEILMGLLGSDV